VTTLTIRAAGSEFRRIGGRQGYVADFARKFKGKTDYPSDPDDDVVCPFDFVEVPGQEAERVIAELRQARPKQTPILFGSPYEAGMLLERRCASIAIRQKSADDWLREADSFDLKEWFQTRVAEMRDWQAQCGKVVPPRGPWPAQAKTYHRLTVSDDLLTNEPKTKVIIGLLPTTDPTETAAHLCFGGWNDCPQPPVHILLARQWHEKYGALQVSNTYETVEFQVAKPLTDREDALRLAMDQCHWCSDSVPETLQTAAAELLDSTVWVFWWD
jgi:hypothetical protein